MNYTILTQYSSDMLERNFVIGCDIQGVCLVVMWLFGFSLVVCFVFFLLLLLLFFFLNTKFT